MSGIAGIFNLDGENVSAGLLKDMTNVLKHRGPDDEGYFIDGTIGLGHRRLSVLDLSRAGHQPMSNEDEKIWMVSDGQIFNFLELRQILEQNGHRFKSDTSLEVILHAYEEYGLKCIERFNGMFSFALWDTEKERLFCARDRFGIKPFYYYIDKNKFYFASEIKSIIQDKAVRRMPDKEVIHHFLSYGCIDHLTDTFFEGIKRLLPAHYILLDKNNKKLDIKRYWDLKPGSSLSNNYTTKFYELFEDSIRLRLCGERSIGCNLSGGLDSSSIVCVVNKLLRDNGELKVFSACYNDKRYDEREFIEAVIKETGVNSYFVMPEPKEIFKDAYQLIWHQDEPTRGFASLAQWNTMKLAKENGTTVLLLGSGGDELLAGYPNVFFAPLVIDLIRSLQIRKFITEVALFPKYYPRGAVLNLFKYLITTRLRKHSGWVNFDQMRYTHSSPKIYQSYLTNKLYDSLVNGLSTEIRIEEKTAMAFSMEMRPPFLDHRLVEYVFSVPNSEKIGGGVTKILLRNAMKGIIPDKVRKRTDKKGFCVPEGDWARELADEIWEIVESESFRSRGIFNTEKIKKEFEAHCKGKKDLGPIIWKLIDLEMWYRVFIDEECDGKW